jgi:ubiquinone/menaquinone biosynthesis C-methylase UbiE
MKGQKKLKDNNIKILDLGCGKQKVPGSIGIDFNSDFADVVHNLNQFPYPFDDEEFDEVHIRNTLVLLDNPVGVMEEVYRICKKQSRIVVVQPYFRSVWNHVDPWIKNFGTVFSFSFYDPDDPICKRYEYSTARFATESIKFDEHIQNPRIIRRIIIKLANRYPRKYELYLGHYFPLDTITTCLRKL